MHFGIGRQQRQPQAMPQIIGFAYFSLTGGVVGGASLGGIVLAVTRQATAGQFRLDFKHNQPDINYAPMVVISDVSGNNFASCYILSPLTTSSCTFQISTTAAGADSAVIRVLIYR